MIQWELLQQYQCKEISFPLNLQVWPTNPALWHLVLLLEKPKLFPDKSHFQSPNSRTKYLYKLCAFCHYNSMHCLILVIYILQEDSNFLSIIYKIHTLVPSVEEQLLWHSFCGIHLLNQDLVFVSTCIRITSSSGK